MKALMVLLLASPAMAMASGVDTDTAVIEMLANVGGLVVIMFLIRRVKDFFGE